MIYKSTQKTKDWVKETPQKTEVNSVASEGLAVPAPQVTPVVLLLNDKNIIWYEILMFISRINHVHHEGSFMT